MHRRGRAGIEIFALVSIYVDCVSLVFGLRAADLGCSVRRSDAVSCWSAAHAMFRPLKPNRPTKGLNRPACSVGLLHRNGKVETAEREIIFLGNKLRQSESLNEST